MWVFNMSISIMFCTVFCIIILFGTISLAAILLCTTCLIGSHHLHPGFLNSNIWLEIVSQRKGDFCFSFQGNYIEREYLPEMCKGWDSDTSKSGKSTIVWWGGGGRLWAIPYVMAYAKTLFNIIDWEKYVFLIELYYFSIEV